MTLGGEVTEETAQQVIKSVLSCTHNNNAKTITYGIRSLVRSLSTIYNKQAQWIIYFSLLVLQ